MNLCQKEQSVGTSHPPKHKPPAERVLLRVGNFWTLKLGWKPAPRVLEQGGFEPVTRLLSALIPNTCKVAINSK